MNHRLWCVIATLCLACVLACSSDDTSLDGSDSSSGTDDVNVSADLNGSDHDVGTPPNDADSSGGDDDVEVAMDVAMPDIPTQDVSDTSSDTSDTADGSNNPDDPPAGLFVSADDFARARLRMADTDGLFATQAALVEGRARTAMGVSADPFEMDDVTQIRFGWCGGDNNGIDDTLSEATGKFEDESDVIRTLALHYALTGEQASGDKALALMLAWADRQTIVNLHDLGVDQSAATLDNMTDGFCSDRPWNFALDAMWQAYGLINVADAYLLLVRNGYALSSADDQVMRDWILRLVEAVNSSFQSWTRWADAHPNSGSYERYRSDNHLSWAMAGLIAGAAALDDEALAAYVLDGGTWTDSRNGAYTNPSSIRNVIDLAIEADGRIYEERILRDPPVGYSLFHLWAIMIVARVGDVHFGADVWSHTGQDGGGLEHAYDRYADYILGTQTSPEPGQEGDLGNYRWLYEAAVSRWSRDGHLAVLNAGDRNTWIKQSMGAVPLLIGVDE